MFVGQVHFRGQLNCVYLNCFTSVSNIQMITLCCHCFISDLPVHHMIKQLLYWFMKYTIVDGTSSNRLSELSLSDTVLMKKRANINIRFTADTEFTLLQWSSKSNLTDTVTEIHRFCVLSVVPFCMKSWFTSCWRHHECTALYETYHVLILVSWQWITIVNDRFCYLLWAPWFIV